ncbi:MAG TPA: FecR family protein [Polyangia bacterium]|jgi:transmembrane sensor
MAEKNDLLQRVGRVGARIDPGLSDRDVERLVAGALSRRTRRTRLRGAGLVVAVAAAGWFVVAHRRPAGDLARVDAPPTVATSSGAAGHPFRFADGSMATPADERAAIAVREDSPAHVSVELTSGRERFEVVPGLHREFVVRAGDVTVTVLGTVFSVERIADRVGVSVERGQVKVDWGVGRRTLAVGESAWFPPLLVRREAPVAEAPARRPVVAAPRTARALPLASRPADPRVTTPSPSHFPESAESLLAAADEARLAGRAREGAALLRRLLDDHRSDPRAPFAAFTLGRVLLMELAQPGAAAAAFAEARALAPAGPLAEDALAREAEAWAKAGDRERARARAREYLRLHPDGRRVEAMRALGGGE